LTAKAVEVGLAGQDRSERLQVKETAIAETLKKLESTRIEGVTLEKRLKRTETKWEELVELLPELAEVSDEVQQQVTYDVKYAGYVTRQQATVDKHKRLAERKIPDHFDYQALQHLRIEAKEKLTQFRPTSLAQAQRISGITPADIAMVILHLEKKIKN